MCLLLTFVRYFVALISFRRIPNYLFFLFPCSSIARGHSLTFASVYSDSPRLERYGEYYFSNLILLCPTAEDFGEYISPSTISSFIDSGRHVLVVLNENVTEPHREILNDIGIEIEEEFKMVIDHFHYDDQLDHGEHTVVTSSKLTQARSIIHPSISRPVSPVLFRGIGHSFIDPSSPLNVPILTAESTSYSGLVGEQVTDISQAVGEDVLLVSGVQTLNNARVAVIGSVELMGNEYMKAASDDSKDSKKDNKDGKLSGNGVLVEQVSKWVFGDQGVLRARELKHKQVSGNEHNPHGYRVLDQVVTNRYTHTSNNTLIQTYVRTTPSNDDSIFLSFQFPFFPFFLLVRLLHSD